MYTYEDRMRAVALYIKFSKRVNPHKNVTWWPKPVDFHLGVTRHFHEELTHF